MISVIIPLYNKETTIKRTIESVLNQTFQDFEIVVIDDGSTDHSVEVVGAISDPRIRLINQPNAGVSAARNAGIMASRYDYVAFLDADDEWDSDFLETINSLISKFPTASVFATNYRFSNQDNVITPTIIRGLKTNEPSIIDNYFQIVSNSHPLVCSSAVAIRKEAIDSIGGFPKGIKAGEDLLTWARLASRYPVAYDPTPHSTFNIEDAVFTGKPKREPQTPDYVGAELIRLAREFNPPYINRYIAHWHKMRSSIYRRLGNRRESIRESLIGLRHNPLNYKLYAYIMLALKP